MHSHLDTPRINLFADIDARPPATEFTSPTLTAGEKVKRLFQSSGPRLETPGSIISDGNDDPVTVSGLRILLSREARAGGRDRWWRWNHPARVCGGLFSLQLLLPSE